MLRARKRRLNFRASLALLGSVKYCALLAVLWQGQLPRAFIEEISQADRKHPAAVECVFEGRRE